MPKQSRDLCFKQKNEAFDKFHESPFCLNPKGGSTGMMEPPTLMFR